MFDLIRSKLESDYVGHPNLMDCGNEQGMQRDWPEEIRETNFDCTDAPYGSP